jgi:hypothetical protein
MASLFDEPLSLQPAKERRACRESVAWVKVWNEEMMLGVLEHEKKRRKL